MTPAEDRLIEVLAELWEQGERRADIEAMVDSCLMVWEHQNEN